MRFAALPLRNLRRRPARTLFTGLGVAVGLGTFLALIGLSRGFERTWTRGLVERGTHVLAVRHGAMEILTGALDQGLAPRLRAVPGVAGVSPELMDLYTVPGGRPVLLSGWEPGSYLWRTLTLDRGAAPAAGDSAGVVIGQAVAELLHREVGDTLGVLGGRFVVRGVARPNSVMGSNTVFLLLPALQRQAGRAGKVNVFNLRLAHPASERRTRATLARLRGTFPELTFSETDQVAEGNEMMRMARAMAWMTSAIALLMAVLVVLNTLLMSVMERTREFGVLLAVGWTPRRIVGLVVIEGVVLALAGGVAGAALGVLELECLVRLPQVNHILETRLDAGALLAGLGIGLVLGVLGSLYPAWRATRLDPVAALRHE